MWITIVTDFADKFGKKGKRRSALNDSISTNFSIHQYFLINIYLKWYACIQEEEECAYSKWKVLFCPAPLDTLKI